MFILDSDHLSILQRKNQPELSQILARMGRYSSSAFFVSIVSFQEQVAGWNSHVARARTQRDVMFGYEMLRNVIADFSALQVLDYDDAASSRFITAKKQKVRVGTMDLRIAAITLANDMTLLTRNTVDFERVPGLKLEDWTL